MNYGEPSPFELNASPVPVSKPFPSTFAPTAREAITFAKKESTLHSLMTQSSDWI